MGKITGFFRNRSAHPGTSPGVPATVQPASKAAYQDTANLRATQAGDILRLLGHGTPATRREIGRALNLTTSATSARVNALVGTGKLVIGPSRTCRVTGRHVGTVRIPNQVVAPALAA